MNRKSFAWFSVVVFIAAMALCPVSKMVQAREKLNATAPVMFNGVKSEVNYLHFNKLAKEECCFGHKGIFKKAAVTGAAASVQHPTFFLLLVSLFFIMGLPGLLGFGTRIPNFYYSLLPVRGNPIYLQYRNLLI